MQKAIFPLVLLASLPALAEQGCDADIPANTPTSNFTFVDDGMAVTDNSTGLTWQRCLYGKTFDNNGTADNYLDDSCSGEPDQLLLDDAYSVAEGSDGWRLPEVSELRAIVELKCYSPAINLEVFPDDSGKFVWSSSPYGGGAAAGGGNWGVYFAFSDDLMRGENTGTARLVRD